MLKDSNCFISDFPSQPTHDDIIRRFRIFSFSLDNGNHHCAMPDPRFARLRSDPRFRTLKRHKNKVAVDSRFSSVFSRAKKKSQIGVDFLLYQLHPSLTLQRACRQVWSPGVQLARKRKSTSILLSRFAEARRILYWS